MTNELPTAHSHAAVATDRPERYGKQLVSHLGRRNGGEWSTEQRSGWIELETGRASSPRKTPRCGWTSMRPRTSWNACKRSSRVI